MASERIEALKKKRIEERKIDSPSYQGTAAGILLGAVFIINIVLFVAESPFRWFFLIGILLGLTLERSRFCFAASVRNPFMVGTTKLLQAVIIGLFVSTIGFFVLQVYSLDLNSYQVSEVPGTLRPVGWHTALGGLIFGIGMVIAGGCASGTLMRVGEGFVLQFVVLIAFIIGSVLAGVYHYPFWHDLLIEDSPVVYLPAVVGFVPALILQLLLLAGLFGLARRFGRKIKQ